MRWLPPEIRRGFHALKKGGLVSVFVIVSMALSIAVCAISFSLFSRWVLTPLPYEEPDRLVLLGEREKTTPPLVLNSLFASLPTLADLRERTSSLTELAAFSPRTRNLSLDDRSVPIMVGYVTPEFFPTVGVPIIRGRSFTEAEGLPGGPDLAVVGREFVDSHLGGGDPLGATVKLDGRSYEVVGVVEEGFEFIVPGVHVWLPWQVGPRTGSRNNRYAITVARMAPGATMVQVEEEVAAVARRIEERHPTTNAGWTIDAVNMRNEFPETQTRLYLGLMQVLTLFLLLIACANIVSLLLARNQRRRREMAVRIALGARRRQIVGQLVKESVVTTVLGGGLGLAFAWAGMRMANTGMGGMVMEWGQLGLHLPVLAYVTALVAGCALLFGFAPALQAVRRNQLSALKEVGAARAGRRRGGRLMRTLIATQVALTLVALGGGGTVLRTFLSVLNAPPGYDREGLVVARFRMPSWREWSETEAWSVLREMRQEAAGLPGVDRAALASTLPENLLVSTDTFRLAGEEVRAGEPPPRAAFVRVTPEYRKAFEIPLLSGRFIEEGDRSGAEPVAVVSRALVAEHLPGEDPLGAQIGADGTQRRIVGVVGDVDQSVVGRTLDRSEPTVYIPLAQDVWENGYLAVHTTGDPALLLERVDDAVARTDPDIGIDEVQTMRDFAFRFVSPFEVFNTLLMTVGVFALLLAAMGVYGVVAYGVGRRCREIGVRTAMGATSGRVVGMFAREGMTLSLIGLAVGGLLLIPVTRVVSDILEGFLRQSLDPVFLGAIVLFLFAVTALASIVPARRASAVDPARVLKAE